MRFMHVNIDNIKLLINEQFNFQAERNTSRQVNLVATFRRREKNSEAERIVSALRSRQNAV